MGRVMRAVALAIAILVSLTGVASAAQPANQACYGKDLSGYATTGGALHPGTLLPVIVQVFHPWGQQVQVHQAGDVNAIPNSCND